MDPENVTKKLGLDPYLSQRRGEDVNTANGKVLGSKYGTNKGGYRVELTARDNLEERVAALIDHLYRSRDFVREISDGGGKVAVFLNVPNGNSLAFMLAPEVLSRIGDMRIRFGLEIFR